MLVRSFEPHGFQEVLGTYQPTIWGWLISLVGRTNTFY